MSRLTGYTCRACGRLAERADDGGWRHAEDGRVTCDRNRAGQPARRVRIAPVDAFGSPPPPPDRLPSASAAGRCSEGSAAGAPPGRGRPSVGPVRNLRAAPDTWFKVDRIAEYLGVHWTEAARQMLTRAADSFDFD